MRITDSCAECLYDKQTARVRDFPKEEREQYLEEVRELLAHRGEADTSPYMVYGFNNLFERRFGGQKSYTVIKKEYNDLVLAIEQEIEAEIERAQDPLAEALFYARVGNYIDFGAMNHVDKECFLELVHSVRVSAGDQETYRSFVRQCAEARRFLLIADNCGEIVLDKLFVRQLKKRFPQLAVHVLVRGAEALNDATLEDAVYVGLDREAQLLSNGSAVAGTIYEMLPDEARAVLDGADVILAKGQGNYESLAGQGRHIFYSFLCKCELFTKRFDVPLLTGMFVEEGA